MVSTLSASKFAKLTVKNLNMHFHWGAQMTLSEDDMGRWLKALTLQPLRSIDLMQWINGPLKSFFPFTRLFMAHGELIAGQIKTTHWEQHGHASDYLEQLSTTFELDQRGSLKWWFENRRPFCIDPSNPPVFATDFEVDEIKRFHLKNIAAHGVLSLRANVGTYFSFCGLAEPLGQWHLDALQLIAPVLNDLYLAHIADQITYNARRAVALTQRQNEIVRLAVQGHDDKTIARGLCVAEKTIRNQLTEIYGRLGINSRSQLVVLFR